MSRRLASWMNSIKLPYIPIIIALCIVILHSVKALRVLAEIWMVLYLSWNVQRLRKPFGFSACLIQFIEVKFLSLFLICSIEIGKVCFEFYLLVFHNLFQSIWRSGSCFVVLQGLEPCRLLNWTLRSLLYCQRLTLLFGLAVGIDVVRQLWLSWELILWIQRIDLSLGCWRLLQGTCKRSFDISSVVSFDEVLPREVLSKYSSLVFRSCLGSIDVLGMKTSTRN